MITTLTAMLALALAVPTWRDVPRTAGSVVLARGRSVVLGAASLRTSFGALGAWRAVRVTGALGACRVSVVSGRLVVRGAAAGRCRVTLTAPARTGYTTAIVRTWCITVR